MTRHTTKALSDTLQQRVGRRVAMVAAIGLNGAGKLLQASKAGDAF